MPSVLSYRAWLSISFSTLLALSSSAGAASTPASGETGNPSCVPVLSRLKRHRIAAGETLDSIARRYNLIPATLMGMNPILRQGKAPTGADILIPPFNGIRVEVPRGKTLKDLAATYNVRSDVLFEVNGCQPAPRSAFIPGVNWSPVAASPEPPRSPADVKSILATYPLAQPGEVLLNYGWRLRTASGQVAFHSGVDLAAAPGTNVLAVGDGTVAFAASQGGFGKMVVINHQQGYQTRYAQLSTIKVKPGQTVRRGQVIGAAGTTGTPSSTDPHLHFELRANSSLGWVAEDPEPVLRSLRVARSSR